MPAAGRRASLRWAAAKLQPGAGASCRDGGYPCAPFPEWVAFGLPFTARRQEPYGYGPVALTDNCRLTGNPLASRRCTGQSAAWTGARSAVNGFRANRRGIALSGKAAKAD
jgi:hypothetical protein